MAIENENGTNGFVMPVAPMYGGGYGMGGNSGFGFGGDGLWFLILFFLLAGNGGWGGGFGGFGGNAMADMYPWMNQSNQINGGFRDQMINDNVTSIRDGIHDLSTQLCNCCGDMQLGLANVNQNICQTGNGITAAITNGFNGAEIAANSRQIANMQQAFAAQTANMQGFNGVGTGIADLKYTVATENCADRTAAYQNTRDIIDSQTRGTQAILDKLCALELDGVKGQLAQAQRENVGLQNQLNMATMRESQTAQTAMIRDGQLAATTALVNELRSCPIPSQPVYGNQPIFQCQPNYNNGCGCGCNGNNF